MGFFSWLGSLFGKKQKAKIPEKVVEYRGGRDKRAATQRAPYERSYVPPSSSETKQAPAGGGRDLFELAGDRAAKRKDDEERAAKAAQASQPKPEPAPEPDPGFKPYVAASPQSESQFEPAPGPPMAGTAEPTPAPDPRMAGTVGTTSSSDDDYSPLDFAREIRPDAVSTPPPIGSEPVAVGEPEVEEAEPVTELGASSGSSADDFSSLGVTFEPGFERPAPADEPAAEIASVSATEAFEPAPAPDKIEAPTAAPTETAAPVAAPTTAPVEDGEEAVPEEHLLDRLKTPTIEGSDTVTLLRKRIETKAINIGGENFEIALYEYQNGTRAARVPRAAIEKMTDIAKQNNLKVLPRHQNAAIMAGRFLGIARAELQERAEKEKYHLVDFTDAYYEICFGDMPAAE